jgi:hypothetical protein
MAVDKGTFNTTYAQLGGVFDDPTKKGGVTSAQFRAFADRINKMLMPVGVTSISSGSGETSLKGVPTALLDVGLPVIFRDSAIGRLRIYQLVAGTDTESIPSVVRPSDYASSTNEKVWKEIVIGSKIKESTSAPTVSDDSVAGYSTLDVWLKTSDSTVYICLSAATGAAVWQRISTDKTQTQTLSASTGTEALAIATPTDLVEVSLTRNWAPVSITGLTKGKTIALRIATNGLAAYPYQITWPSNISFNDGIEPELGNNDATKYDWIYIQGIDDSNNGQIERVMYAG